MIGLLMQNATNPFTACGSNKREKQLLYAESSQNVADSTRYHKPTLYGYCHRYDGIRNRAENTPNPRYDYGNFGGQASRLVSLRGSFGTGRYLAL